MTGRLTALAPDGTSVNVSTAAEVRCVRLSRLPVNVRRVVGQISAMTNKALRTTLQRCAMVAAITIAPALDMAQPAAELVARVAASDVTVSFDLHSQRTDDLERRLATGAPVSVVWIVNARQRARFWRDRPGQRAVVSVTARRAGASDLFTITRTVNGQHGPAVEATLADSYRYLTAFELLPLFSTAELSARGGYRLEIMAILDRGGEPMIETAVLAEAPLVR